MSTCTATDLALPQCHNFTVARAAHIEHVWENFVDLNGDPFDWTGYGAQMALYVDPKAKREVLSFDVFELGGPAGGNSLVLYTGTDSDPLSPTYDPSTIMIDRGTDELRNKSYPELHYSLWLTDPLGVREVWYYGVITFKDVARFSDELIPLPASQTIVFDGGLS